MIVQTSCSNKKNTALTRMYHSVNTRYNVHFNANEAFKESMRAKEKREDEGANLSKMLHVYPEILDSADLKHKGAFTTTIDKATKAIKLHSIKTRPQRDPNKRGDKEYQSWVNRKEFNPFLINSWMLLAKSEFEEGSYLRAITTFMYITKIYDYDKKIVSESKLWIARAYSEMGWRSEAENVLRKMEQNDEIHHQLLGMYASVKANLHVHNKQYESAIPYLEEAIIQEKNKNQKRRDKYLLGQLYTETGNKQKAYKAFGDVRGLSTPFAYAFNSKLRQLEVSAQPQQKIVSELNKMTKGSKHEDYLDQVYTALADLYLNSLDTVKAIENYSKAIEKSQRAGYDKALAQVKLGGLHFLRQAYIQAQPHYTGALPQIRKSDELYPLVSLRSEVLDKLVVHAKVVHEQDSLLMLANMPEMERIAFIEEHIAKLKKEEERKAREADQANRQQEYTATATPNAELTWSQLAQIATAPQTPQTGFNQNAGTTATASSGDFYFYNSNALEQGKISFQRKWGRRPLEDNWRRKNKTTSLPFGSYEDDLIATQSDTIAEGAEVAMVEGEGEAAPSLVTDKYDVAYYLQQLPLTSEAKEASYTLIDDGLFNMGLIYKDLLEDYTLAINTFQDHLTRFPGTPHQEEIYYQLFMIYLRLENDERMAYYRNLIINNFPTGKYTIPLSDQNYAWNFKYMGKMQEELYQETYQAYLAGNVQQVRRNYEDIQVKFPFVSLMPKFAFLNSLTYAQTKDASELEKNLMKLIANYPQADVTPMATNILKNIKDGMILLSDGTPITGMDWTMAYASDSVAGAVGTKVIEYRTDVEKPYVLLLMFEPKTIDRNELLYQVADYNFSNYVVQTYDLNFDENPMISSLEISGFKDFKTIKSYLSKALLPEGLIANLDKEIIPVPMSANNRKDMYPRLGLEEYMTFYADSLGLETPQLLAIWGKESGELIAQIDEQAVNVSAPMVEGEEKEENKTPIVVPETGEEKVTFPIQGGIVEEKKNEENQNDKEVNLEEVLTEGQVKFIEDLNKKHDSAIDAIQGVIDNPVDGLKNLFNRNTLDENLTKEEKAALKRLEKEEKEHRKELQKTAKAKQDSIISIEKFRADSVTQVERALQDAIQAAEKEQKDQAEFERKERTRKLKEQEQERIRQIQEREDTRKQQLQEREDRRKQQERDRQELLKQRERERQDLQKKREDERKERERAADELRKQKERERQELLKQRERK